MTFFQACVLGLVQGLTEFLPVSSSAHLILFPWFFGWQDPGLAFDVFLHVGTLVAVFVYFARDWLHLLSAGLRSVIERRIGFERERLVFWMMVVGNVPAVLAGVLLHDYAETFFRTPLLICVTLSVVGFLLYWIDGRAPTIKGIEELKLGDAIWIGVAQACAIIPGVSRSGATMTMGRALGLRRRASARFSFLLSFPIILGACAYELKGFDASVFGGVPASHLIGGFVCSTLSGLFAIHFLMRVLQIADYKWFAWYRIALAGLILVWSVMSGH
ncbi:MAG: undecaprenyl-diphosphatase UppP [Bdellovibrionaceae bacterium]|nr:undecaprenyl-diphosphatase UppP [Bdellovibrionales bacterium]MCB9254334.1 undecaprenyl-diphosphatase UppP [Pseudobdellovibrionaceae bacterium]